MLVEPGSGCSCSLMSGSLSSAVSPSGAGALRLRVCALQAAPCQHRVRGVTSALVTTTQWRGAVSTFGKDVLLGAGEHCARGVNRKCSEKQEPFVSLAYCETPSSTEGELSVHAHGSELVERRLRV
jgi:hypothetical protein